MPQVKATTQANAQHLEWPSTPGVIARLDLRVKYSNDAFGKLSFTASGYLKQDSDVDHDGTLIDRIIMAVGYPDSNNILNFKNSGTVLKSEQQELQPMIWIPSNSGSILKTVYSSNGNNALIVRYQVLFNLQKAKALGLADTYAAEVTIGLTGNATSSCLVTISIT